MLDCQISLYKFKLVLKVRLCNKRVILGMFSVSFFDVTDMWLFIT